MSPTRFGKWLDKASAQVLADYRPGVWNCGNVARSRFRVAAMVCMVIVIIILTSLSYISEPSLRSRTYTYRVTNPATLPSGSRIVSSSCPCSKNMLLWSDFVAWPRFASNQSSAAVKTYCRWVLNRPDNPPADNVGSHLDPWLGNPAPNDTVAVPASPDAASSPAASPPDSSQPPHLPGLKSYPMGNPPQPGGSGGGKPPSAAVPLSSNFGSGRHLLQENPPVQAPAAETSRQDALLLEACTAWVQDVAASLDPSNLAYNAEAYQASQLKTPTVVQEITKLWLGSKLKYHLQLEYRVAAATAGNKDGNHDELPASYQQLLAPVTPQVERMFASAFAEIRDQISYASYKHLCNAPHCDVIATKPAYAYVIDNLAKFGGLCSNALLVTAIVWHTVTAMVPTLKPYDEASSRVGLTK